MANSGGGQSRPASGNALRALSFKPSATAHCSIRAVDGAGNAGAEATLDVKSSDAVETPLPGKTPENPIVTDKATKLNLPKLGEAEVAVIDELDKVQPVTGKMLPEQPAGYLAANHLWNAADKQVKIQAGKNEFVAFQVLVRGQVKEVKATLEFPGAGQQPKATFYRMRHVASSAGPMPDPLVPLGTGLSVPATDEQIEGQKSGSLVCEVYVPHEATAGQRRGTLTLTSGEQTLKLNVALTVWDFTLPDYLSFLPEMNCYGLPDNERDYYRLAHRNRTVLNRVPYHQNGHRRRWLRTGLGRARSSISPSGTSASGRTSMARRSPICRERACRSIASICR